MNTQSKRLNLPWYFLGLPVGMFLISVAGGFFCFWCFAKACFWWDFATTHNLDPELHDALYFWILTYLSLGVTLSLILGAVYCLGLYFFGTDPLTEICIKEDKKGEEVSFEDHLKELETSHPGSPLIFKLKCALFFVLDPIIFIVLLFFFWWFLFPFSMACRQKWIKDEIREEYKQQGKPEPDFSDTFFEDYGLLIVPAVFILMLVTYPILYF